MAEAEQAYTPNPLPVDWKKFRHASALDDNLGSKVELRYTDFIGQGWNQNYTDDTSCSASAKYFAAHTNGNSIAIVQLHKPGRKKTVPCATYHGGIGKVTVSRWSPHNHGLLASGDENGSILVNYFEDSQFDEASGLLKEDVEHAMTTIETGLAKKITSIAWHPVITNLIAVAGGESDGTFIVKFFDTDSGEELLKPIVTRKQAMSLTWSWDCQHLAFCDKTDKGHTLCIYNVKNEGGPTLTGEFKSDLMRTSCLFMNDAVDVDDQKSRCSKYVVLIGSSGARSKTHLNVFDLSGNKVGKFSFAGTDKLYAMWDTGRNLLWYLIKGSGQMRSLTWRPKNATFKPTCHYTEHNKRLKGGFFVPQQGCQVLEYVIMMVMGLEGTKNDGEIWPFRFIVPRRKKGEFEAGLYPDVIALTQDMNAGTWANADVGSLPKGPRMASLDPNKAEKEAAFKKKIPYAQLNEMVTEYESFIMNLVSSGALEMNALPKILQQRQAEAAAEEE